MILCKVFPFLPKVGNKGHTRCHSACNRPPRLSPAFGSSLLSLASSALILKANLCQRPPGRLEGQRSHAQPGNELPTGSKGQGAPHGNPSERLVTRNAVRAWCQHEGRGCLGASPPSLLVLLGRLGTRLLWKRSWISWETHPGAVRGTTSGSDKSVLLLARGM